MLYPPPELILALSSHDSGTLSLCHFIHPCEAKGLVLQVNVDKTKFMTSGSGLNPFKYPYGVCCQGVGDNYPIIIIRRG